MPGKNRFSSEEQSTTISTFSQQSFAGGLNTDRPASEIGEGELAKADNIQCFPKDVIGRPGTTLFKDRTLPGTGTVHSIAFHQSSKRWLLHRGSELWKADETMADFWELIYLISSFDDFNIDSASTITENRENFIISTASGIFHVLISDDSTTGLIYQANTPPPDTAIGGQVNTTDAHVYRILYTYVRLTGTTTSGRITPGAVLEQETGSVNIINAEEKDYSVIYTDEPISATNPLTVQLSQTFTVNTSTDVLTVPDSYRTGDQVVFTTTNTLPSPLAIDTVYYAINTADAKAEMLVATTRENAFAGTQIDITDTGTGTHEVRSNYTSNFADHHTHIGIYMTNDLGSGIIDPETNTGFNPEQYIWVKDVAVTSLSTGFEPNTFDIDIDTEVWISRAASGGFGLGVRQWKALPSGDLGQIAGGWFFTANSGDTYSHYCQINDSALKGSTIGFYVESKQQHKLQDGITAFIDSGDYLVTTTFNKTYMYRLNSFENVGVFQSVFQLTTPSRIDDTIGVIDPGTISQISEGRFMAVCSDASVRIFDTTRWGSDLSLDKVKNSEIRKMQNGSVSAYWQGAYFLWYRKDSTDTHNENTLRLAVEDAAGEGWTTYSGSNWIKPPLNTGTINFVDANDVQRIIVIDFTSMRPYWIETFNAFTGSGLTQTFIDKSDDPGLCPLGKTYIYDALDDASFDTSLFTKDTAGTATISETQSLLFDLTLYQTDEARVITIDSAGAGDDFETSVFVTGNYEFYSTSNGVVQWVELKLAAFASPGDDLEIGVLAGDGIYLYLKTTKIATEVFTHTLYWKAVQGVNSYSSSASVGPIDPDFPTDEEFKITLVDDTLTWYFEGVEMDSDTDSAWQSFGALKSSFSASDEGSGTSGFRPVADLNYFSFIADSGLPNSCIGPDGLGSATVDGREPSATIKTAEIIGSRESNTKQVQEAHAYIRPFDESIGLPSTFEVNAKDYIDGSLTANETVNDVRYAGDIQFFKQAEGRRLQAEFITNSTQFRMTAFDVDFTEKREKAAPLTTEVADDNEYTDSEVKTDQETWQDDYFSYSTSINWKFRIARYDYTLELTQGVRATDFKDIQAEMLTNDPIENEGWYKDIGPDGKVNSALGWSEDGGNPQTIVFSSTKLDLTSFRSFVLNFWVQSPVTQSLGHRVVEITAGTSNRVYIQFPSDTTLDFGGISTVPIDDVKDGAWHNFWVIRAGTVISVYQNTVLKGTMPTGSSTSFGGEDFTLEFDTSESLFFDVSLKTTTQSNAEVISIAALTDYYNDIINNEGRNYLP